MTDDERLQEAITMYEEATKEFEELLEPQDMAQLLAVDLLTIAGVYFVDGKFDIETKDGCTLKVNAKNMMPSDVIH